MLFRTLRGKGWLRSYRARDVVGRSGRADPGRGDALAGCEDVDNGAIVAERGTGVTDGGGTYSDRGGSTRRGGVRSVNIAVAG
jgi:hypothetical protein